ncbi:MAG: hypothetical protein ABIR30_13545 [Chitinophagaceae bacterium]
MKREFFLILFCLFVLTSANAQKGNELLVYAVKGSVMATYNNQESAVKIGKVLKPGTTITVKPGASMTMVCKQGKPLSVNKEGSFPVNKWKDSCKTGGNSITASYFKYIWSEFYTRSPEHKEEEERLAVNAVTRSPSPIVFNPNRIRIEFNPGLDTLNYTGVDFPLSWTCYDYSGKYSFKLYDLKTGKAIYKDSLHRSIINTSQFGHLLQEGKKYAWTVSAPKAATVKKRILNYIRPATLEKFVDDLKLISADIPEEEGARYFRIAYMLEQHHYLAEALAYYKKATETAPEMEVYRDKLLRFKSDFWVID